MLIRSAWVITDGNAGMENQACGLVEAMGIPYAIKRVQMQFPWKYISPFIRLGKRFCLNKEKAGLTPPWPDLIVASGRQSVLPALMVKEESKSKTKIIYLQTPAIAAKHFDVVISPAHDNCSGNNVFKSIGAPHQVTQEKLDQAYKYFSYLFSGYTQPRLGVLLGGSNKVYSFDEVIARNLAKQLKILIAQGVSVMITPSRRTDAAVMNVLHEELAHSVYIWDGICENPYFGILAWSDLILVSCDSVSMISEACATCKPVYLLDLPGESGKFQKFHHYLKDLERIQWWDGCVNVSEASEVQAFDETKILALKALMYLQKGSERHV
ncbi:MAG: mitochondrial fission ELM1 family protein [Candidatus Nitrosoglobus sp.]